MDKFNRALKRFDQENEKDPNQETFEGKDCPKELLYAQRMSAWLERLEPKASEPLKLAAHAQHICRWMIPRSEFPTGRVGYLKWRTGLYDFHAKKAAEILREIEYDVQTIERVQTLIRKKNIKTDPEMQLLEDVICLVFLENYFLNFSKQHDESKIIDILRKTWKKMSPRGQKTALEMQIPNEAKALVQKALS